MLPLKPLLPFHKKIVDIKFSVLFKKGGSGASGELMNEFSVILLLLLLYPQPLHLLLLLPFPLLEPPRG